MAFEGSSRARTWVTPGLSIAATCSMAHRAFDEWEGETARLFIP